MARSTGRQRAHRRAQARRRQRPRRSRRAGCWWARSGRAARAGTPPRSSPPAPSRGRPAPSGWPTFTISHAAGRRAGRAPSSKNSACRQVEGDVGLAVGVDRDHVVAGVGAAEERARVLVVEVQPRVVHVEVAAADLGQLAVDLHPVDARAREELLVGARGGPGGVAEHRHAPRRPLEPRERQHQVPVPVVVGEHGVRVVDRVLGLALVQLEQRGSRRRAPPRARTGTRSRARGSRGRRSSAP